MGIGVVELVIIVLFGLFWIAVLAGLVFCVFMLASGRAFGPKNCPHCGADLRRSRAGNQHTHTA
jgi:hypothetical protein